MYINWKVSLIYEHSGNCIWRKKNFDRIKVVLKSIHFISFENKNVFWITSIVPVITFKLSFFLSFLSYSFDLKIRTFNFRWAKKLSHDLYWIYMANIISKREKCKWYLFAINVYRERRFIQRTLFMERVILKLPLICEKFFGCCRHRCRRCRCRRRRGFTFFALPSSVLIYFQFVKY